MPRSVSLSVPQPTWKSGFSRHASGSRYPSLWNGLVGLWCPGLGNTGGTLRDVSGRKNDGTWNGTGTHWEISDGRTAGKFNGTDDLVDFGDILDFEQTDSFSLSAWAKSTSATPSESALIVKQNDASPFNGWGLHVRGADVGDPFRFEISNNGAGGSDVLSVNFPRPSDTLWHLVSASYDGSSSSNGVKAYVDGKPETLDVIFDTLASTTLTSIPLQIGGRNSGSLFDGHIGGSLIWNRVVSASEFQLLYQIGRGGILQRKPMVIGKAPAAATGKRWNLTPDKPNHTSGTNVLWELKDFT